jgi:hypothetical protein
MSVNHKPVRADLINTCRLRAAGLTACSSSPALSLCRLLIKRGFDPERPLLVFRGEVLALKIRTLREGASLEVNSLGTDFVPFRRQRAASLVRKSGRPLGVGTPGPQKALGRVEVPGQAVGPS